MPYHSRTAMRLLGERVYGKGGDALAMKLIGDTTGFMQLHAASQTSLFREEVATQIYLRAKAFWSAPAKLRHHQEAKIRAAMQSNFSKSENFAYALAQIAYWTGDVGLRRELASAAIRLADEVDVTPLVHELLSHKEDANDPVIPQLVWLAYEKNLARRQSPKPKTKNSGT